MLPGTVLGTRNVVVSKAQSASGDLQAGGRDREHRSLFLYNFIGVSLKDNKLHIFKVFSLIGVDICIHP